MATESVEEFVDRATRWIQVNLPSLDDPPMDEHELQRLIFEGGFAGLAFPVEYGGAGLSLEHHKAFFDAADSVRRQVRTKYLTSIAIIGPTMLEHASHETKARFLPPMLRGDVLWVQLLSEPGSGSDMAAAVTRLTPDGDQYILNGSKMWSSFAHLADWAVCLCRSNWDVPKHHGLSMIALPLKGTPGLTIRQVRKASGELGEFCEEFFDDVVVPKENMIGNENQGWLLARTLLLHERYWHGNVNYGYRGAHDNSSRSLGPLYTPQQLATVAQRRGALQELTPAIADAYIETVVGPLIASRINAGLRAGTHQGPWGSILKLRWSTDHQAARTELSVLGAEAVIWDGDQVNFNNTGTSWLSARVGTIAGGSNEMQRNTISERLLGLPRDVPVDLGKPFKEVRKGKSKA